MSSSNYLEMQYESMQIFANLSTTYHACQCLVEAGAISAIIRCMKSADDNIARCATAAIANFMKSDRMCCYALFDEGLFK